MLTQLVHGRLGDTVATIAFGPRFPRVGLGLWKGSSMEKGMCWGALGISGVLLLLFLLDIIIQFPFGGLSMTIDILGILATGVTAYLAWDAVREIR